jgi:hypothetical protein
MTGIGSALPGVRTFAEAEAGPACDQRAEPAACYGGDGKVCSCSVGIIAC